MQKTITESNVRFLIEKHLREAGIVVAFPQRDVHLDASKPLEMRIIDSEDDQIEGGDAQPEDAASAKLDEDK